MTGGHSTTCLVLSGAVFETLPSAALHVEYKKKGELESLLSPRTGETFFCLTFVSHSVTFYVSFVTVFVTYSVTFMYHFGGSLTLNSSQV